MSESRTSISPSVLLQKTSFTWVVCSPSDRWCKAIKRFAPEILPQTPMVLTPVAPETALAVAQSLSLGVVLWDCSGAGRFPECVRHLTNRRTSDLLLPIASVQGLSNPQKLLLGELGLSVTIGQPEELLSLAPLIRRYTSQSLARL